jgi:Zinc carboxypeptidase
MTPEPETQHWRTPFERGNGNQSSSWEDCIAFHTRLALAFPQHYRLAEIGRSDGGSPLHGGVFSADGVFEPGAAKVAGRAVLFINNGIHPGEPEGIDATMALLRDLCLDGAARQALGNTVLVCIPAYNVDGLRERGNSSRVNQLGPEAYGFRGTSRHLDLNRDFVKGASRNTWAFWHWFGAWDPDVFIDTHTSNGADYQHTMTLIATQPDKLGGECGAWLRDTMLPQLYAAMAGRGFPMCPYVNPVATIPDDGIADFADTPRFSTGWAALHHTIGFMPETHMLKAFGERLASTRALIDATVDIVRESGAQIRALRAADRAAFSGAERAPLAWALDRGQHRMFDFHGYRAEWQPSRIGRWQRLRYDRSAPWRREIRWFNRLRPVAEATLPRAYLLPQAWPEVAERLRAQGVAMQALTVDRRVQGQAWRIVSFAKRPLPFEGEHLHTEIELTAEPLALDARAGDWLIRLGTANDRLIFETLEPLGADSYFRWGFFDAVLDRKEGFSDYVFEDEAERLLASEPELAAAFAVWTAQNPRRLDDAEAALGFLHQNSQRWAEPAWRRYPVLRIVESAELGFVGI